MRYIADLHIHSYYSRATSKLLNLEHINKWGQLKGLQVIATGDITHPKWLDEMQEKLVSVETGLYSLKKEYSEPLSTEIPRACQAQVNFILSGEISSIYKKNGTVRKIHNVIFMPDLDAVQRFQDSLDRIGNIRSDGRPILGIDSRDLLEIVLETDPQAYLIPDRKSFSSSWNTCSSPALRSLSERFPVSYTGAMAPTSSSSRNLAISAAACGNVPIIATRSCAS